MLLRRDKTNLLTVKMHSVMPMVAALLTVCCLGLFADVVVAQNKNESSRRENSLIQAAELAGGKVYKISAAGQEREISFYLSSKPIGDEQLKGISGIANVVWMNLAGSEITNGGLKQLAGMPLTKLHLERTKIGDDGLKNLKSLKDLEYLNLYGTKVTDAGLENLKGLKNLKKVYVWQTEVSEAGMDGLMKQMPGLQIVGEVKLAVIPEEPKEEMKEGKEKMAKQEDAKKVDAKKSDDKKNQAKKEKAKANDANNPGNKKPSAKTDTDKEPVKKTDKQP